MTQRNYSLDLIKTIAMIGVIALHTTHDYIGDNLNIAAVLYETGVIAIPLFFMTSGYLLLGRENINYRYSFKKIIGILRFTAIMCILLWSAKSIHNGFNFNISDLTSLFAGAFLQRGDLFMFWYFGAMIIIYLLLPPLNKLYSVHSHRPFITLSVVLLLSAHIVFIINLLPLSPKVLDLNLLQPFRIYLWLLYFCIGGMIKWKGNINVPVWIVIGLAISNICYQSYFNIYLGSSFCEYYYSSFFITVFVVLLFIYLVQSDIRQNTITSGLSSLFLPVYTLHHFVQMGYHSVLAHSNGVILPPTDRIFNSDIYNHLPFMGIDENTLHG